MRFAGLRPLPATRWRIGRQPGAERNRLVRTVVELHNHVEGFGSDFLDMASARLRHIADIACAELLGANAPMRSEQGLSESARDQLPSSRECRPDRR
jgi:hypothetical protein